MLPNVRCCYCNLSYFSTAFLPLLSIPSLTTIPLPTMKCFHLCLLATSIGFRFAQANRLKDIKGNAEKVAELTPGYQLDEDKQWIIFPYDSGGEDLFRCDKGSGLAFTTIGNKEYAGCCPPGNKLFGSPDDKTWYCCAEGHEMSGSAEKGYQCCPKGYNYDGHKCAPGYDNTRCDSGILEGMKTMKIQAFLYTLLT